MPDFTKLLDILRCPVCRATMRVSDEAFVCQNGECRRSYAIVDDIPVLRPDTAVVLSVEQWPLPVSGVNEEGMPS